MKKAAISLFILLVGFVSISFQNSKPREPLKFFNLADGEMVDFKTGPALKKHTYEGWFERSSYDLTRFNLHIDTQGNLKVSELRGCSGKHQGELSIFTAKGSLIRIGDTLKVNGKTVYDHFYLLEIKEGGMVDSFSSEISIDLVSRTLKNTYCPNSVRISSEVSICAIPEKMAIKELYKPVHKDNTIGEFVYFSIQDANGKVKHYPQGDYVIIGADQLSF